MTEASSGQAADREFETRVDDPRGDRTRAWELFVRESPEDPLRHAGSVSAPTAEIAREQAAQLFGWTAGTVWLCPADEARRFAADGVALSDRADSTDPADQPEADRNGGAES
jgi:rSAM-partnered protein